MQVPRPMRAAGGAVETWRDENWLSEGDPCVFPRMSPCAQPPDQPQIGSYWGMQGLGRCGAAGVESQGAGAQSGNDFKPITLRPPWPQPKLQAHSALNKVDQGHFTAADEHNIQLFSSHLGNTITKARLHEKALREKQRLTDLYQMFKALNGAGSLDEILKLTSCALHGLLHASLVFVFLLDSPRQELWARYSTGTGTPHMIRVKLGSGLVGKAAQDNQPVVLSGTTRPSKCGTTAARASSSFPTASASFPRTASTEAASFSMPPTPSQATGLIPTVPIPQGPASGPAALTPISSATLPSGSPRATSMSPPALQAVPIASPSAQRQLPLPTLPSGSPRAASMSSPPALQAVPLASTSARQAQLPLPTLMHLQQQQQQQQQLTGIDKELMNQIAPALGGEPVRSLLVQPLAVEDKVVGAILCVNKNEGKEEHDLFFEDCYTESDTKVMALFALEVSQMLAERSLEVALASAMLNVSYSQPQTGFELNAALVPNSKLSPEEAELLLRTQMMNMYYGTKFSHEGRHTTCGGTVGQQPSCSSKPQSISPHHNRSYTLGTHPSHLTQNEGMEAGSYWLSLISGFQTRLHAAEQRCSVLNSSSSSLQMLAPFL